LLVTAAIVLAFRTFFFQPMAIPSGSAQPTLWGIQEEDLRSKPNATVPTGLKKLFLSWWSGVHYYHLVAESDGELFWDDPKPAFPFFPFVKRQVFHLGGRDYTAWFVPDNLAARSQLVRGKFIRRGEDILKLKVVSGDHLFVNCMVYNFQRPKRGEIIVFHTHDIDRRLRTYRGDTILIPDTHYIKRLVALGDEHVRIGNDRHAVIDGRRLDSGTPHFENVYGFNPNLPPQTNRYSGHVNEFVARPYERAQLAPLFPDDRAELVVRRNHYLVFGDNTMNSYDGRAWGDFPRDKVIGRASFVFWPITERFGWGYR
jgi:signal peptidase I